MIEKSKEWHDERAKGIGGSDASKIMAGDWYPLWEIKTSRSEGEDLSWVLPVQIGTITEELNRQWFAHHTGIAVSTGGCEHLVHLEHPFMCANLDGRCDGAIFEAKHVSAFAKEAEILTRYYPQLQHCMAVAGEPLAHLSVFYGTLKWEKYEIPEDKKYQADLIEREREFWTYVETDLPPPSVEAAPAPVISLDDMREVNMTGDNEWAAHANDWAQNRGPAKLFETAAKELKAKVEPDVKKASGHGISISRAKNGALTIKES